MIMKCAVPSFELISQAPSEAVLRLQASGTITEYPNVGFHMPTPEGPDMDGHVGMGVGVGVRVGLGVGVRVGLGVGVGGGQYLMSKEHAWVISALAFAY